MALAKSRGNSEGSQWSQILFCVKSLLAVKLLWGFLIECFKLSLRPQVTRHTGQATYYEMNHI